MYVTSAGFMKTGSERAQLWFLQVSAEKMGLVQMQAEDALGALTN